MLGYFFQCRHGLLPDLALQPYQVPRLRGSLGGNWLEQPKPRETVQIEAPISIHRSTIKALDSQKNLRLSFTFECTVPVRITVLFHAIEADPINAPMEYKQHCSKVPVDPCAPKTPKPRPSLGLSSC